MQKLNEQRRVGQRKRKYSRAFLFSPGGGVGRGGVGGRQCVGHGRRDKDRGMHL